MTPEESVSEAVIGSRSVTSWNNRRQPAEAALSRGDRKWDL